MRMTTNKKLYLLLSILSFVLVSCDSIPKMKRVKPADIENNEIIKVNNIEVVSILPNTFDSIHLGASRLTNKIYNSDAEEWAINDFITGLTIEAIQQDKRYNYVNSNISRDAFNKIYADKKLSEKNFNIKNISKELDQLHTVHNVDTLVLVIENKIEDPIKDTTQDFSGYGIYQNALSFKAIYLFSYIKVLLIDTASKTAIKQRVNTDYIKLPKEFWAAYLEDLPSKEQRYIRNETLRMAGRNVLSSLVEFNLINEEVAYTTESGTKLVTNRIQEAGNYGELYEDAVNRVYLALNIEKHFERYALLMQTRHEQVINHFYPYQDVYLNWMREYVSWELLKPKMIEEYRKEFTADELNEIADFAETEVGAKMLEKIPMILREQENIWLEEANKKVEILDEAVMERREKIIY